MCNLFRCGVGTCGSDVRCDDDGDCSVGGEDHEGGGTGVVVLIVMRVAIMIMVVIIVIKGKDDGNDNK